jgi:hypothetical protein
MNTRLAFANVLRFAVALQSLFFLSCTKLKIVREKEVLGPSQTKQSRQFECTEDLETSPFEVDPGDDINMVGRLDYTYGGGRSDAYGCALKRGYRLLSVELDAGANPARVLEKREPVDELNAHDSFIVGIRSDQGKAVAKALHKWQPWKWRGMEYRLFPFSDDIRFSGTFEQYRWSYSTAYPDPSLGTFLCEMRDIIEGPCNRWCHPEKFPPNQQCSASDDTCRACERIRAQETEESTAEMSSPPAFPGALDRNESQTDYKLLDEERVIDYDCVQEKSEIVGKESEPFFYFRNTDEKSRRTELFDNEVVLITSQRELIDVKKYIQSSMLEEIKASDFDKYVYGIYILTIVDNGLDAIRNENIVKQNGVTFFRYELWRKTEIDNKGNEAPCECTVNSMYLLKFRRK